MYQFPNDGPLITADHQFHTAMETSTRVVASLEVLLKENPQLDEDSRGHPFSTYAKISEKLTFLSPCYARVRLRIRE